MSNEKIEIVVSTKFLPERSDPTKSLFFFSYDVKIKNNGKDIVQLIDRYWNITDAKNNTEEISGPGVIGNQPVIQPGQSYEYKSFCPLKT